MSRPASQPARFRWPRRLRRSSRGVASLEYLGLLPWVLLVAMLSLQALTAVAVSTSAEDAARAAARAAALGEDPQAAAETALPGWLEDRVEDVSVESEGSLMTATVELSIPLLVGGLIDRDASATATFERG